MIIPRYRDICNCYADFSSDNHNSFGQDNNIKRRVIAMKKRDIISAGQEYVVTDNYTAPNGRVYNRQEQNAGWARKWVDENEK